MKKLIIVLLGFICCCIESYTQSAWQAVNSPVNENFVSVSFSDESNGWIVSENGTLIETLDGGITWTTSYPFPGIHLNSIYFSDDNHGCMVGYFESDSSLIVVTHDGGNNWLWGEHERVNRLNDVFFINNNIGWAVGSYDELNLNCCLYTIDGGQSWVQQSSITVVGAELYGVHFRDENIGQVCGFDGAFFLTNNGGSSWAMNIATPAPLLNLNAIFNWGVLTGCIVGEEGTALYTINNWYQYIETVSNTTENLNGVSGNPTTNELWAVGNSGTIIYTPSYLLGWTTQSSGVTDNLNDICMLSASEGWAVGDNGTILQYTNSIGIHPNKEIGIEIYPNPVEDFFVLRLTEEKNAWSMELLDVAGKLIEKQSLYNRNEIVIDVSSYHPGIYFLKISNVSNHVVEKLIIQ